MAARVSLNPVDRLVSWFAPAWGVRRLHARSVLAQYEGAKPTHQRKFRKGGASPNKLVEQGAVALRDQMRYLERNHDLVLGALDTLVNNTVGPQGIDVEPQPIGADGEIHTEYAEALKDGWRNFCRQPEVTWQHDMSQSQRLLARTWFRDGEAFAQQLMGPVPLLDHGTRVPYSLELMEPDLIPMDYNDGDRIRQGVERNAWGRPVAYWAHKGHPDDSLRLLGADSLKRIPAERMLHMALRNRIGQLRGVTRFAAVITRIEDLKDYEESERIAAKVAAMLTAYVKRQAPVDEGYVAPVDPNTQQPVQREFAMSPGMFIDNLVAGEEIGLIDSKRPNPNLVTWRAGQLRALAAGIGASYSSISRDYNGTYSAQRQELVEQWVHYATLTDLFTEQLVRRVYESFVLVAHMSGVIKRPPGVDPEKAAGAYFAAPSMPWIDPMKEIQAWLIAVQAGFASEFEVIRRRGATPDELLRQVKAWRTATREAGLRFSSDYGNAPSPTSSSTDTSGTPGGDGAGGGQQQDDTPPADATA